LQDDEEVVLAALDPENLKAAQGDKSSPKSLSLQYVSPRLRNDRDVVERALDHHIANLQFASDILRNDEQIALAAVSKFPFALEYCGDERRDDVKVVKEAIGDRSAGTTGMNLDSTYSLNWTNLEEGS
jgi:hypothetical protein